MTAPTGIEGLTGYFADNERLTPLDVHRQVYLLAHAVPLSCIGLQPPSLDDQREARRAYLGALRTDAQGVIASRLEEAPASDNPSKFAEGVALEIVRYEIDQRWITYNGILYARGKKEVLEEDIPGTHYSYSLDYFWQASRINLAGIRNPDSVAGPMAVSVVDTVRDQLFDEEIDLGRTRELGPAN